MDVQLFETETNLCVVENVDRRRGWIDMHAFRAVRGTEWRQGGGLGPYARLPH